MDLLRRLTIFSTIAVFSTICALGVFFCPRRFRWLHQFNEAFLALFGIQSAHPLYIRYLVSWLLTTCLATVNSTLIINISDALFLLSGLSGIPLDPWVTPLVVGGVIVSILLFILTFLPALTMPASWPTALGIVGLLHLYGVPYGETSLGLASTFLFFAATAIGFVAVFLALYLLFRTYLGAALLSRIKGSQTDSRDENSSAHLS